MPLKYLQQLITKTFAYVCICTQLNSHRNPDSVKKRAITDCHLLVFILLLALVIAVILTLYVIVESGSPSYELSRIPNADHPSEYIGVR